MREVAKMLPEPMIVERVPSPAQKAALRLLVEEIRDSEIQLARERCRVVLLQIGVHPQQKLVEAILGWGFALHDRYASEQTSTPPEEK